MTKRPLLLLDTIMEARTAGMDMSTLNMRVPHEWKVECYLRIDKVMEGWNGQMQIERATTCW